MGSVICLDFLSLRYVELMMVFILYVESLVLIVFFGFGFTTAIFISNAVSVCQTHLDH